MSLVLSPISKSRQRKMAESNNNEPKKNEDGASNSGKDAPLLSLSDLRPDKIATMSPSGAASLASVKKEPSKFGIWIHKHCPWLFNIHSLFYFCLIIFAVAMGWTCNDITGFDDLSNVLEVHCRSTKYCIFLDRIVSKFDHYSRVILTQLISGYSVPFLDA